MKKIPKKFSVNIEIGSYKTKEGVSKNSFRRVGEIAIWENKGKATAGNLLLYGVEGISSFVVFEEKKV